MGRMLDTLKLGEARRTPLTLGKPPDAVPVQECVVDWEIGAEVPFVEVGGPNKKVELSPGLQVHPPQPMTQPPHLPAEAKATTAAKPAGVYFAEPRPMVAAFQPWPTAGATLPKLPADVIAYHQPDHPASKQYAELLEAMLGGLKAIGPAALLLSGIKGDVGAGTVLLNLAAAASLRTKSRVVVVDLRGGLAECLECPQTPGITEVLAGTLALEHAILSTCIPSLSVLTCGKMANSPGKDPLAWILGWLRQRHDLILVLGPPADALPGLANCAGLVNATYVVLPEGTPATAIRGIASAINDAGGRLGGLIHTHFEI